MSDLNIPQKILMITLYILTAIASLVSCFVVYQLSTMVKPWTLGVTYASTLTANENNIPIVEVSVKTNKNKNGQAVYDMQWNSYTDAEGSGISGFGIQCVGDWEVYNYSNLDKYEIRVTENNHEAFNSGEERFNNWVDVESTRAYGDFYFYYTGDNGQIYYTLSLDEIDDFVLIDINGEFYKIQLKEYTHPDYNNPKINWWGSGWFKYPDTTSKFTWFEVFDTVMASATKQSADGKYSEFPLALKDLSSFIEIYKQEDKGQYMPLSETSEVRNFFSIPVTYSNDGAESSEDSMFGMIANSNTWSIYNDTDMENYWNAYSKLTLTEEHLNYVYNENKNSYYAVISSTFAEYLRNLDRVEITFDINFENLDFEVFGMDLNHLDFDIEEINITTNSAEDFVIYEFDDCDITPTIMEVA